MRKKKTDGNAHKQTGKKKTKQNEFSESMGKLRHGIADRFSTVDKKRLLTMNVPYIIVFYLVDKLAWLYRHCVGESFAEKMGVLFLHFQLAFKNPVPSFHIYDLVAGMIGAAVVKAVVYMRGKMQRNTDRAWSTVLPDGAMRRTSHRLLIRCLTTIFFSPRQNALPWTAGRKNQNTQGIKTWW